MNVALLRILALICALVCINCALNLDSIAEEE